jgi:HMG box factor, other
MFAPNGGPQTGMVRSPSTSNAVATQTPGRPHPLAHANLHRQVPYTMSSPPPPGSAIARVRPFGEAFAGGVPQPMTEAEYRARFSSQPRSPDPKRRRFNGPGVMVPTRGVDLTSPTVPYPRGHPYSPRRVSLPRPIDGTTHSVHHRAVTQGQAQRSTYPPQHPRYASVDSRDPSLTLAPLQTPTSAAAPTGPDGSKRSSSGSAAEAQIMSIPAVNKLRLLAKAAPPLPHPGSVVMAQNLISTSSPGTRGAILAIDGSEEDVHVITEWLGEFLKNESDEFLVKAFLGPDISAVMAGAHREEEADLVGTQQQRYLKAISEWHWVSKEVIKFVTTGPKTESGAFHDTSVAVAEAEKAKEGGEEMEVDVSTSPTSAVSPRTISRTERLSLKSPTNNNNTNDGDSYTDENNDEQVMEGSEPIKTNPPLAAPPAGTSPSTPPPLPPPPPRQSGKKKPFPIALLPRYQLSTVDTASLIMPITDSYLPIDHWQWAAALWRGCVGPDVTVVAQEESSVSGGSLGSAGGGSSNGSTGSSGTSGAGGGVEVRLGQGDVRAVIVRKGGAGRVVEAGALRRVGFEIVEFLRR